MRFKLLLIFSVFLAAQSIAQDYSKKPYASIHMYAERLMMMPIMETAQEVDFNVGKLYYYKEKDIVGSFVHVSGGFGGDYKMAMWKMENGNDLVGVTSNNCGPVCIYECSFFEFTKDDSVDVTNAIFPLGKMEKHLEKIKRKVLAKHPEIKDTEAQFKFELPHDQGIVSVEFSINYNQIEFEFMQLLWDGEKFVIQNKIKDIP